jgi:hypothetical protein
MNSIYIHQLNSLSECFKTLHQNSGKTKSQKITIETVGDREDLYFNILPILFDIDIIYKSKDQFDKNVNITKSDAIFLDGEGISLTQSKYNIKFDIEKDIFYLSEYEDINILKPLEFLKANNLFYY